jgi:CRISPR-associated protein Cas2
MSDLAQLRVITYDITDNKRRAKVAKALEKIAARVQESVFEARLNSRQAEKLMVKLESLCSQQDSLRLYTVPDTALHKCTTLGGVQILDAARYWLL